MSRFADAFAAAILTGLVVAPAASWAEARPKAETTRVAESSKSSGSSDFEENRKAHEQKSKENKDGKGAN